VCASRVVFTCYDDGLTFLAAFFTLGFLAAAGFLVAALVPVAAFFVGVFLAPAAAVVCVLMVSQARERKERKVNVSFTVVATTAVGVSVCKAYVAKR
jgi:hypothetical protein